MEEITQYMEEHCLLQAMHLNRSSFDNLHILQFNNWFANHIRDAKAIDPKLAALARGPTWDVTDVQNQRVHIWYEEKIAQQQRNSSVCLEAFEQNEEIKQLYYGYIEEIWELDYVDFKFPLFCCHWVQKNQVNPNDNGHTTVNLNRVAYKNEQFIPANLFHQVFYIVDPSNKNIHVVMPSKRSIIGVDVVISEEDYNNIDDTSHPFCSFDVRDEDEVLPESPHIRNQCLEV
jgi:hypothetical protein